MHRPKEGFLMPITEWMRGDLRPGSRQTLHPARLARHGIFSPPAVAGARSIVSMIPAATIGR